MGDVVFKLGNWRFEEVGFVDGGNGPWNVPPWLICGKPRERGMVLCKHHGTVIRPWFNDDWTIDYGGKERIIPKTVKARVERYMESLRSKYE
jgi:hypothetical protein